jgi:hypothetical protein
MRSKPARPRAELMLLRWPGCCAGGLPRELVARAADACASGQRSMNSACHQHDSTQLLRVSLRNLINDAKI